MFEAEIRFQSDFLFSRVSKLTLIDNENYIGKSIFLSKKP